MTLLITSHNFPGYEFSCDIYLYSNRVFIRWVDRVKKPGDAFMQAAKKAQRRERKDIYAALQKEHTEREAELANKYRDRAAERRDGKEDADMMGSMGMGSKFTGISPYPKSVVMGLFIGCTVEGGWQIFESKMRTQCFSHEFWDQSGSKWGR